jgi:hypothetical protein
VFKAPPKMVVTKPVLTLQLMRSGGGLFTIQ